MIDGGPIPFDRLSIVTSGTFLLVNHREVKMRVHVVLFGGATEPFDGFGIILAVPLPSRVEQAEVQLRLGDTRVSRFANPLEGFSEILGHAAPFCESVAEPGLRFDE